MPSAVIPLLALALLPPIPPSASFHACDPVQDRVCAGADLWWDDLNLWLDVRPASSTYSITGFTLTIPGVFASQWSQEMPGSFGEWWFDLSGDYATVGEFDPVTETDHDAQFGNLEGGIFHFLLAAPLGAGEIRIDFAAVRPFDYDTDYEDHYFDDYVAGFGSASLQIAPTTVAPEPVSTLLLGTGLLGLATVRRRGRARVR